MPKFLRPSYYYIDSWKLLKKNNEINILSIWCIWLLFFLIFNKKHNNAQMQTNTEVIHFGYLQGHRR